MSPQQVFEFFSGMGRTFISNKILVVVSSLGHLSIKKFSDRNNRLGSKIRGGGGGVQPSSMGFLKPIFLTIKMTFNLDKFWYGVR